jgi:DNA-binding IclR family transcriptional regulator
LTAEQLERLLADVTPGLSAGAIAQQAGVASSRVLALLRELEASGKVRRNRNQTLNPVAADHR